MPDTLAQDFGTLIRELREMRGWTQKDLGARMRTANHANVSNWERGIHVPSLESIFQIAEAFEVPPHTLVEEIEMNHTPKIGQPAS